MIGFGPLAACSGRCDYPDDIAKDGSRCGARAASVRPGGRNPDFNKVLIGALVVGGLLVLGSGIGSRTRKPNLLDDQGTQNQQSKVVKTSVIHAPMPPPKTLEKRGYSSDKLNHSLAKEFLIKRISPDAEEQNRDYSFNTFYLNYQTSNVPEMDTIRFISDFFEFTFNSEVSPADMADLYRVAANTEQFGNNHYDGAVFFLLIYIGKLEKKHPQTISAFHKARLPIKQNLNHCSIKKQQISNWLSEIKLANTMDKT